MSKSFDIRKKVEPEPVLTPKVNNSASDYIKQNRQLFAPFKTGQLLEQVGENFKPVQEESLPLPEEAKEEYRQTVATIEQPPPDKPVSAPLKVPTPIKFENLSPEKQKASMAAMDNAYNKLKAAGLDQARSNPPKRDLEEEAKPKHSNNPGLPDEFANGPDIAGFMKELRVKEEALVKQQAEPKEEPISAGGLPEDLTCQHCGWERKRADPEEPSDVDKLNFIQSILGQISFRKSYTLLGDRIKVEFRTLTSEESDMTFTQVAYDVGKGDILEENSYFRTLADYRMCLGLASYTTTNGKQVLPGNVHEWQTDKVEGKNTKLIHIVPWLYDNVLTGDSIRRAIAASFFRFQRLVERLEAHVDDPNFWPAIER